MNLFDLTTRLWEDPRVPQVHALRSRSPLFSWKDESSARNGSYEPFECPSIQNLNGKWQFRYYERPEEVDLGVLAKPLSADKQSKPIVVPGNWTRQNRRPRQWESRRRILGSHQPFDCGTLAEGGRVRSWGR